MQEDNLTELFGYIIKVLFKAALLFLFGSIYGIHEYIENCDDVDRGYGNRYDQ